MPQLSTPSVVLLACLLSYVSPVWSQSPSPKQTGVAQVLMAQNVSEKAKSATDAVPAGVEVSIKEDEETVIFLAISEGPMSITQGWLNVAPRAHRVYN
jgi:hypothetical protein